MLNWYDPMMGWRWNVSNIFHNLMRPFTKVFSWIIKSIQYSIFLWNDHDWDYMYLVLLLQYKIRRMRKAMIKNNIVVRSEEIASQMKHAEDLIEKWYDNNFCSDLQEEHDKKWGDIVFESGHITREKATTPELRRQENKEQREIIEKADKEKEECLDDLFKHIKKFIEEWWD